jgi:hypothetical protein
MIIGHICYTRMGEIPTKIAEDHRTQLKKAELILQRRKQDH